MPAPLWLGQWVNSSLSRPSKGVYYIYLSIFRGHPGILLCDVDRFFENAPLGRQLVPVAAGQEDEEGQEDLGQTF